MHVEKHLGWFDYTPLNLHAESSALLNTSICRHGDKVNVEGYTRLSVDFRAIPISALTNPSLTVGKSLTKSKTFDTNDYYISSALLF